MVDVIKILVVGTMIFALSLLMKLPEHPFNPLASVNLFIGTAGEGNALVGPQIPHGMVKLGPDTASMPMSGYEYTDDKILGFSHTHLEGAGGESGYANILFIPTTGPLRTTDQQYASSFRHNTEIASPGYYAVTLEDYGVRVELTATARAALHRYTFPRTDRAHVLIDVTHSYAGCSEGSVKVVGEREIEGYATSYVRREMSPTYRVFFCARFSKPFLSYGMWKGDEPNRGIDEITGKDIGFFADYSTAVGEQILVKVGISFISTEQARRNLEEEIPYWEFDQTREQTEEVWATLLSRIRVDGGSEEDRVKFYSSLYRSLCCPVDYAEYGRYYCNIDGEVHQLRAGQEKYFGSDYCVWDTFRTTHPLQQIIEPEIQADIAQSYVNMYKAGGWMPKCPWQAEGYHGGMIGFHTASVIAGIYAKGFRGFDTQAAYDGLVKTATVEPPEELKSIQNEYIKWLGQYLYVEEFNKRGYVSDPKTKGGVSRTLEYAYDNWCIAQLASDLGTPEEYVAFLRRARNYENSYNPSTGFMQPRREDGSWFEPFDPASRLGFCEGNAWDYSWFVPHDVAGLITLMGGEKAFVQRLDAFFEGGYYNHGNEPDWQIPYLYVYAGMSWKTQERIQEILTNQYSIGPTGLPGNDDSGAMSAWYVFSAIGFYPVNPGSGVYIIGDPLFKKVTIDMGDSPPFTIRAAYPGVEEKQYIQGALLNGEDYEKAWITYAELRSGGTLTLILGNEPGRWGTAPTAPPPSMSAANSLREGYL